MSTKPAMHLPSRPSLGLTLNAPAALTGGGVYGLPPYAQRPAYEVDAYPGAPKNWMRSKNGNRSYFTSVKEGHGMWLDFNSCWDHDHDVAVVVSVQGINPVTGLKCVGSAPVMEQYRLTGETYEPCSENVRDRYFCGCPKHKVPFKDGRVCPECGYAWTKQNYLCTTGTPQSFFWIDGFRGEDGVVRQYLFTADSTRGVAAQLIGEERVFAIGVAFFLSKKKHPSRDQATWPDGFIKLGGYQGQGNNTISNNVWYSYASYTLTCNSAQTTQAKGVGGMQNNLMCSAKLGDAGPTAYMATAGPSKTAHASRKSVLRGHGLSAHMSDAAQYSCDEIPVKQLEIAAGAKIEQKVYDDPQDLSYWQEEPAGLIYVNYCDEEACDLILGTKSVGTKASDAFMASLKVGN